MKPGSCYHSSNHTRNFELFDHPRWRYFSRSRIVYRNVPYRTVRILRYHAKNLANDQVDVGYPLARC